ncbi:MAG: indole-3-glycerol-phosphate synthase [Candidatus Binatia bacterium]|nr:MAG: indole-3-glycerol-phosphate synthase [Candidatus Binatia bacterium]
MHQPMILDRILAAKRAEVQEAKTRMSEADLRRVDLYQAPRRDFWAALQGRRAIIAEVKKASPSKGIMCPNFDPVALARSYASGGAAAISVLTESQFFLGHLNHLREVRAAVALPLLRKDFVFDPYQLHEARAWGADAVLLIVRALDLPTLARLLREAEALELAALVEVHDENEVEAALSAGARLIGINNRDLATFSTSTAVTEKLAPKVCGAGRMVVAESGIETRADIERLERVGVRAFLIGEALVRSGDPAAKLRELLSA